MKYNDQTTNSTSLDKYLTTCYFPFSFPSKCLFCSSMWSVYYTTLELDNNFTAPETSYEKKQILNGYGNDMNPSFQMTNLSFGILISWSGCFTFQSDVKLQVFVLQLNTCKRLNTRSMLSTICNKKLCYCRGTREALVSRNPATTKHLTWKPYRVALFVWFYV